MSSTRGSTAPSNHLLITDKDFIVQRPVYVHGIGAISPLGLNWPTTRDALHQGQHAIRWVKHFDVTDFPSKVAAFIRDFDARGEDRRLALAKRAAAEAWSASEAQHNQRLGVFIGAESGRATFETIMALARAGGLGERLDHSLFGQNAMEMAHYFDASVVSPATVASTLARQYNATGPVQTISLACASSNAAIVEAARAIDAGECDVALCGGVGADVDPLMMAGFGLLGALSASGLSCPFDTHRDGFVVGEGAAMLVLSSSPNGARAQVLGTGRSLDAYHLTKPHPDGQGAVQAMRAALEEANLKHVDYIQAHGTSTPLNDAAEAQAIATIFQSRTPEILVSSVKGALGHWIAGAGALGALCAIDAIDTQVASPTASLTQPDPACALRHITGRALGATIHTALANAFAFGGANSTLIFGRP